MWTEERPLKFGAIIHDLVDAHIQVDATEKHAAELGIEFVGREIVPFIPPPLDTSVEWLRLAAKKPDWVYIFGFGMTFVTLMKDAARLGIRDKGIQLLAAPFSADERTLKVTGKDTEGIYAVVASATNVEAELPEVRAILEYAKSYRGYEPQDVSCTYIMANALVRIAAEGIRLAIAKVGLENLTGQAVREGLMSIRNFEPGVIPPVTMSDEHPWWCDSLPKICIVREGRQVPVTSWLPITFYPEWFLQRLEEVSG